MQLICPHIGQALGLLKSTNLQRFFMQKEITIGTESFARWSQFHVQIRRDACETKCQGSVSKASMTFESSRPKRTTAGSCHLNETAFH